MIKRILALPKGEATLGTTAGKKMVEGMVLTKRVKLESNSDFGFKFVDAESGKSV